MRLYFQSAVALVFAFLVGASIAYAQTTAFTYQGKLADTSLPASGQYDFIFRLYNLGGVQIGTDFPVGGVQVTNGIFTVQLDFTAPNAFDGSPRVLEIAVKKPADPSFTTLSPRQPITSAPYSIKSINADNATNAAQLGGIAANQYVVTGDARLSDARNPLPNSGNYIQNQNAGPQASSNFNISGNGTAAGTLNGNIVNATTQYNLSGNRVLTVSGLGPFANSNTFAGVGSGSLIAPSVGGNGSLNSFFGNQAGGTTSTGQSNAFFGYQAGMNNTTGSGNAFFGRNAGTANTIGTQNTFFGELAGHNSTADFNSFFGQRAGFSNTTGQSNAFFAYQAGMNNTTGSGNAFFGRNAGTANATGIQNAFFGELAGHNSTADLNSFFGQRAGFSNTTGVGNAFFGASSGLSTTTGGGNTFFGTSSGLNNLAGVNNSLFGNGAGVSNTMGSNNTIIGKSADVGSNSLNFATAIGAGAVVSASNTVMLGRAADTVQVPGGLNVVGPLTAALPSGSGNYIQNTTSPQATSNFNISGTGSANILNAVTQFNIGGNRVLKSDNTDQNTIVGISAGSGTGYSFNSFFGSFAGSSTTVDANANSFFGRAAGIDNTTGGANSFFGADAGRSNIIGHSNSFFGLSTGSANTGGGSNSFFGADAGDSNLTGNNNTLIGTFANVGANNLTFASALGSNAVVNANDTIVLGKVAGTYNSVARPADAVVVPGFVYREYTAATRSAAIPIAYGSISVTGTILSGTGNFTVAHTVTGEYDITINGEVYSNTTFTVTTTPVANSPRITAVADVGTAFRVNMWNLTGTLVDNAFQFTIWKTNPN